jgi:ribonuclease-3
MTSPGGRVPALENDPGIESPVARDAPGLPPPLPNEAVVTDDERLRACEEAIGYVFRSPSLLRKALTHSSLKDDENPSNERMEFLGDSILGMIVSEYLYGTLPAVDEGELTRVKSVAVSSQILARCAEGLRLAKYLRVGKGISSRSRLPRSILANAVEAITAAIYLDSGLDDARLFVLQNLLPRIEEVLEDRHARNYKSLLQQLAQREYSSTPTYRLVAEEGPDHQKSFEVAAVVEGREFASARGKTKKTAEQQAAKLALRRLRSGRARRSRKT